MMKPSALKKFMRDHGLECSIMAEMLDIPQARIQAILASVRPVPVTVELIIELLRLKARRKATSILKVVQEIIADRKPRPARRIK